MTLVVALSSLVDRIVICAAFYLMAASLIGTRL
jgi:hypothetical protein